MRITVRVSERAVDGRAAAAARVPAFLINVP
jgi:hypothetical protein